MKKITNIILITILLFTFQGCSVDDEEVFEESTDITTEFNGKTFSNNNNNTDNDAYLLEGCEVEYTFNDPTLTPTEKAAIRNSYNFFISYTVIDHNTEMWSVDCNNFDLYNQSNPGCDAQGCYIEASGCPSGGCGSTPPPVEEPDDPFEADQHTGESGPIGNENGPSPDEDPDPNGNQLERGN